MATTDIKTGSTQTMQVPLYDPDAGAVAAPTAYGRYALHDLLENTSVATIADLATLTFSEAPSVVYVRGRSAEGDGGEGVFVWLEGDYSSEVEADPHSGIYVSHSPSTGAWVRRHDDYINTAWFGSGEDGIQRATQWGIGQKLTIFIPSGEYEITAPIQVYPGYTFRGAGIYSTRLYVSSSTDISCILTCGKPDGPLSGWPIVIENLAINAVVGGNSHVDGISTADISATLPSGSTYWRQRCDGVTIQNVWVSSLSDNIKISGGDIHLNSVFSEQSLGNGLYLINCNGVSIVDCTFFYSAVNVRVAEDRGDPTYSTYSGIRSGAVFNNCTMHLGTQRDLILANTEGRNAFIGCDFGHYADNYNFYSIALTGSSFNKFVGCSVHGARTAVILDNSSTRNQFVACSFEKIGIGLETPAIDISTTGSRGNVFTDCHLANCGANGIESDSFFAWNGGTIREIGLGKESGDYYAIKLMTTSSGVILSGTQVEDVTSAQMQGVHAVYDVNVSLTNNFFSNMDDVFSSGASVRTSKKFNAVGNQFSLITNIIGNSVVGELSTFYAPTHPTGTSVTYAVGDRCINSSPSAGNPKAWVCTVAGAPGTWVSEGNL